MSTSVAHAVARPAVDRTWPAVRRAQTALYVGAAAAIGLAAIGLFATTSSGDGKFHHVGDYLQTADGIPYMLALLAFLPALRSLQERRDGRLARAGVLIAGSGAVVLLAMFSYGLIRATGSSLGPTYVLAALATVVGVALVAAGSWRAGLLPRWLIAVWAFAWTIGGTLPLPGPGPLLLAAVYTVIAATLSRRAGRRHTART